MTMNGLFEFIESFPRSVTESELHIIKDHINNLKILEDSIKKSRKTRLDADLETLELSDFDVDSFNPFKDHINGNDHAKAHYLISKYESETNNINPRLTYNPIIVALWGILESSIYNYCKYASERETAVYNFKEVNGKNLIQKSEKYLNEYLGFDIDYTAEPVLKNIMQLRNYIAHTNGSLKFLPESKVQEIERVIYQIEDIEIIENNIVVTFNAIKSIFSTICAFLGNIDYELSKKYHPMPNLVTNLLNNGKTCQIE